MKNSKIKKSKIGLGKVFSGTVISDKMEKTVVVEVVSAKPHPLYRRIVRSHKKFYADNQIKAKTGNKVEIKEVRPLSKTKRFSVTKVLEKVKKT